MQRSHHGLSFLSGAAVGVYKYLLKFKLSGALYSIPKTPNEICESTPRVEFQRTRDIPSKFGNRTVVTHVLVWLLTLGVPEYKRSGHKCATPGGPRAALSPRPARLTEQTARRGRKALNRHARVTRDHSRPRACFYFCRSPPVPARRTCTSLRTAVTRACERRRNQRQTRIGSRKRKSRYCSVL